MPLGNTPNSAAAEKKLKVTDEQLDALLADDEASAANSLEIFTRIHERRRKIAHAKAKAVQPELKLRGSGKPDLAHVIEVLRSEFAIPLSENDRDTGGLEYLSLSYVDCLIAGDLEDILHAANRIARKAWACQPHLGPIESAIAVKK